MTGDRGGETAVNRWGLTFDRWLDAVGPTAKAYRSWDDLKRSWAGGEDPTEWRAWAEKKRTEVTR